MSEAVGNIVNIFPINVKKGAPGGWGTESVNAHAINSPQSQNENVGWTVITYIIVANKNTNAAKILLVSLKSIYLF